MNVVYFYDRERAARRDMRAETDTPGTEAHVVHPLQTEGIAPVLMQMQIDGDITSGDLQAWLEGEEKAEAVAREIEARSLERIYTHVP